MTLSEMFRGCLGPFLGSLGPFLAPEPWVNSTDTQSDVYELFRSVFRKFRSIFGSFRSFSLVNILQNNVNYARDHLSCGNFLATKFLGKFMFKLY